MKIKKIIALCKSSKRLFLYDISKDRPQMLSDEKAAYFLEECPRFTINSLYTTYDISEKQAEKIVSGIRGGEPEGYNISDCDEDEVLCEPFSISIASCGKQYRAYKTSEGVAFVDEKYFAPFEGDCDYFEIYERRRTDGQIYFAVKIGLYLKAIILPTSDDIDMEDISLELGELFNLCRVRAENRKV